VKFQTIHTYLELVEQGLAPPIKCGGDEEHMLPLLRLGPDEEPEFWCIECSWTMRPGIAAYDSMKRVIDVVGHLLIKEEDPFPF
jgi:hypothetical protein